MDLHSKKKIKIPVNQENPYELLEYSYNKFLL